MDRSVKLLSIERPKKEPLRPLHPSPTKMTQNPNSPARELNGGHERELLSKEHDEAAPIKNGHTEIVCKRHHKEGAEYDERKHVYKTDHNTFEITVKLKKPHGTKGSSEKLIPIVEVAKGDGKHQTTVRHKSNKPAREGSWADILSRKTKGKEIEERSEPESPKPKKKEPRSTSQQRKQRASEDEAEVDGRKHAHRSERKKEPSKRKNKTVFTITKPNSESEEEVEIVTGNGDATDESEGEVEEVAPDRHRRVKRSEPLRKTKPSTREVELDQLLLIQKLKEENRNQKDEIEGLNSQLEKAQSELREYMETIKELYDLATVLKNENQMLLDAREQIGGEKLASAIAENESLKRQLSQITQQHEMILKPKDEELKKLKFIVNDVKTTLEEEINELKSLPPTTSVSSNTNTAGAKCSSASFFRNLNLTDEERDNNDERRSESQKTSISEIHTIDDDDDESEFVHPKDKVSKDTNQNKNQNQNSAKPKRNNERRAKIANDDNPSIDDDSSSTQYLYLFTADKNRDFEQDDDLDGLRN